MSSSSDTSAVETATSMSWETVVEDFTRTLSYGPAILSTASRTSSRSPSVASPAVPVTITSTVPCPLGWSQSACANRTPWTASAALMNVSSIDRAASSDQDRSARVRSPSSSSVSLPSRTIQSSPFEMPSIPLRNMRLRVICPSGTLYREPSFSASTRTSTDRLPFCRTAASMAKKRSSSPLMSFCVLKMWPFSIFTASPWSFVLDSVTRPCAFWAFLRFFP